MLEKAIYPIPVVRIIVPDKAGNVLILRRKNTVYSDGQWNLPGGKVEYGATVENEVRKELMEETALDCTSMRFLFYQDSLPLKPGDMHCINFYFECAVKGSLRLNDESSKFYWIGPEDLKNYQLAFRNDEGLQKYWERFQKR